MRTIQKTTLEYWALLAEIAGGIAIVVSVIYLGVQIRANTKVLRSSEVLHTPRLPSSREATT